MSFNGNEGTFITLEAGADLTAAYRSTIQPGEVIGVFMGKEKIQDIIDQSDCVGIRFYFAINSAGEKTLVLVGAASDENDLIEGLIADEGSPCPKMCSSSNALNS